MSLLDNPLVLKYFGYPEGSVVEVCEHEINLVNQKAKEKTALRILAAMQGPIKKGELTLSLVKGSTFEYDVEPCPYDFDGQSFHSGWLRLPDRFQPSQTKHKHNWKCECGVTVFPCDTDRTDEKPTPPPVTCACVCSSDHDRMARCDYRCRCVACVCCGGKPLPAKDDVEETI